MAWSETMLIVQHFYNIFNINQRVQELEDVKIIFDLPENVLPPAGFTLSEMGGPSSWVDRLDELGDGSLWFILDSEDLGDPSQVRAIAKWDRYNQEFTLVCENVIDLAQMPLKNYQDPQFNYLITRIFGLDNENDILNYEYRYYDLLVMMMERIYEHQSTRGYILNASKWEGTTAPFTQTIEDDFFKEWMNPLLVSNLDFDATPEEQKAYMKAFSIISSGVGKIEDGRAIFKVYKKPTIDVQIGLRGIQE